MLNPYDLLGFRQITVPGSRARRTLLTSPHKLKVSGQSPDAYRGNSGGTIGRMQSDGFQAVRWTDSPRPAVWGLQRAHRRQLGGLRVSWLQFRTLAEREEDCNRVVSSSDGDGFS